MSFFVCSDFYNLSECVGEEKKKKKEIIELVLLLLFPLVYSDSGRRWVLLDLFLLGFFLILPGVLFEVGDKTNN